MAKDILPTPATPASRRSAAPRRTPARRARPVEAGDTLARPGAATAEADRVARRTRTAHTVHEMVVAGLLDRSADGRPPGETLRRLQTLIAGASPDEVKALRRALFRRDTGDTRGGIDPDTELSSGWREGAYPYRNLLSRNSYEKQKYRLQVAARRTCPGVFPALHPAPAHARRDRDVRPQLVQPLRATARSARG
jgi:hypothetical protein